MGHSLYAFDSAKDRGERRGICTWQGGWGQIDKASEGRLQESDTFFTFGTATKYNMLIDVRERERQFSSLCLLYWIRSAHKSNAMPCLTLAPGINLQVIYLNCKENLL
ncbi:hypothetical protein SUGI_0396810 [Cryptomeria japonica]|nr:hypothetical protein SUGI_0396810 [Cryptomeria japonica]